MSANLDLEAMTPMTFELTNLLPDPGRTDSRLSKRKKTSLTAPLTLLSSNALAGMIIWDSSIAWTDSSSGKIWS